MDMVLDARCVACSLPTHALVLPLTCLSIRPASRDGIPHLHPGGTAYVGLFRRAICWVCLTVWCAIVERERKRKEEKERKKKLVRRTWTVTVAAPLTAPLTHSGSQLEEAALASKQASTAAAGAAVDDDRYAKYTRMIKVGVPLDKVKEAMTVAGLNFSDLGIDHLLDGSVKPTPTPQAAAGADDAGSAP